MNDHSMRDAYDASLRARDAETPPVAVPLERVAALVGREGNEADRLRTLDVLMSTAEGRRELEVAWAAARAAQPVARTSFRWRMLAAAAVLVVVAGSTAVWMRQGNGDSAGETLRGTESPLHLVAPRGESLSPRDVKFVWGSVKSARDYLLVVVDRSGKEVFASTTRDTAVSLPDSIRLEPGGEYLWWVQTVLSDGTTISAVTEKVRVKP